MCWFLWQYSIDRYFDFDSNKVYFLWIFMVVQLILRKWGYSSVLFSNCCQKILWKTSGCLFWSNLLLKKKRLPFTIFSGNKFLFFFENILIFLQTLGKFIYLTHPHTHFWPFFGRIYATNSSSLKIASFKYFLAREKEGERWDIIFAIYVKKNWTTSACWAALEKKKLPQIFSFWIEHWHHI